MSHWPLEALHRLKPWQAHLGKRLTQSPKLFVRDSGLLHALLGHPAVGVSWEGFVLDNLITAAGPQVSAHFYRTSAGAEIDLPLHGPDGECWAIEVKRSLSPKPERGFHTACDKLRPQHRLVVYPGQDTFPLASATEAIPAATLCRPLAREAQA